MFSGNKAIAFHSGPQMNKFQKCIEIVARYGDETKQQMEDVAFGVLITDEATSRV